jgi:outer membrane protein assembly factor BamD (BamD/ComL family)
MTSAHYGRNLTAAVLLIVLLAGCGPSAVNSPEAERSVDALYTAVTSRRPELLDQCEQRLQQLLTEEKLTQTAHEELAEIIQQARQGEWQAAAETLDSFIRNQPADE